MYRQRIVLVGVLLLGILIQAMPVYSFVSPDLASKPSYIDESAHNLAAALQVPAPDVSKLIASLRRSYRPTLSQSWLDDTQKLFSLAGSGEIWAQRIHAQIEAATLALTRTHGHRTRMPLVPSIDKSGRVEPADGPVFPMATCTVITAVDSGAGSLRQCLDNASAQDTIAFDPAVFTPTLPVSITLLSVLPDVVVDGLTIDASNAGVILNGSVLTEGYGLFVDGADGVTVRGLQIVHFPSAGIVLNNADYAIIGGDRSLGTGPLGQGNLFGGNGTGVHIQVGSGDNQISGNLIGINVDGAAALGNQVGVSIIVDSQNNVVGGITTGSGNLISGNAGTGVWIQGDGTTGNHVAGNYIGTNITGTAAISNVTGIMIGFGAADNVVGGNTTAERNVISGNDFEGISIQDTGTTGNQVRGNYIGIDANASNILSNYIGVQVNLSANGNTIGGATAGAANFIGGNGVGVGIQGVDVSANQVLGNNILPNVTGISISGGATENIVGGNVICLNNVGILIAGVETSDNEVLGNYIGTTPGGAAGWGNTQMGVSIGGGATQNVIGGETAGARNIISGNGLLGVYISDLGTTGNQVLGNYIGTDPGGTFALGNDLYGVNIGSGATNNVVGGHTSGARNVISGNDGQGVSLFGSGVTGNQVLGNYIGTDASGTTAVGNGTGVSINGGAASNVIGGNIISGNVNEGVYIVYTETRGNQVLGNYIGVDASGSIALANYYGVIVSLGAQDNVIGGSTSEAKNVISGNDSDGVVIRGSGTDGNRVLGNYIGTGPSGMAAVGNWRGIYVTDGAQNNVIGGDTAGERNIISGNIYFGIRILDADTIGNRVLGNYIGADAAGGLLGNGDSGILVRAATNDIGASSPGAGNLIAGNGGHGVVLEQIGATENVVSGNDILSNTEHGIYIFGGANLNTIGISNTIAYNGVAGVVVGDSTSLRNTITRNSIYGNGGLPIDLDETLSIDVPTLADYAANVVSGQACAGCRIEVFASPTVTPTGMIYLGGADAGAGGAWSLDLGSLPPLVYLTANATDLAGTTSEFCPSLPVQIVYLPLVLKSSVP